MKRLNVFVGVLALAALLSIYVLVMYKPATVVYERERPVYYTTEYTEPNPVYIVDSRPYNWGFGGWGLPLWGGMTGYKKPFYHNEPPGGPKGPGLPGMGGPPPAAPPAPAPPPSAPAPPPPAPPPPAPPSA